MTRLDDGSTASGPARFTRRQSLALAATAAAAVAGTTLAGPATGAAAAEKALMATPDTGKQHILVHRWNDRRDFECGSADGVQLTGRALKLKHRGTTSREYTDPFGDGTARQYEAGSWTSQVITTGFPGDEAIASWNADTPTGTWVEIELRTRMADNSWTKWFVMGRWTSGMDFAAGDIHRTSLDGQNDTDAAIWTDTYSARTGREFTGYQLRVTLLRPAGSDANPSVRALTVMSNELLGDYTGPTSQPLSAKAVELDVPPYSQNIHKGEYPEFGGGGQVWCSPTSSSMVMRSWGPNHSPTAKQLADIVAPNGDPQVPYAAMHTWDFTYEGAGNWPFNAAYAHTYGLTSFVTRLRSLREAELFVRQGIPLIISLAWDEADMPEAGYGSNGHLMVLRGFTAEGDPILNDPASNSNDRVRSIYTRVNYEKVWQNSSHGVVYVYTKPGVRLPANVRGLLANW